MRSLAERSAAFTPLHPARPERIDFSGPLDRFTLKRPEGPRSRKHRRNRADVFLFARWPSAGCFVSFT
jgi:hypothetical protein